MVSMHMYTYAEKPSDNMQLLIMQPVMRAHAGRHGMPYAFMQGYYASSMQAAFRQHLRQPKLTQMPSICQCAL
jgi:hypothetical protein